MTSTHQKKFKQSYGVKKTVDKFAEMFVRHNGGPQQKRINGPNNPAVRGHLVTTNVLPMEMLEDTFNLVHHHRIIFIRLFKNAFLQLKRPQIKELLEAIWKQRTGLDAVQPLDLVEADQGGELETEEEDILSQDEASQGEREDLDAISQDDDTQEEAMEDNATLAEAAEGSSGGGLGMGGGEDENSNGDTKKRKKRKAAPAFSLSESPSPKPYGKSKRK